MQQSKDLNIRVPHAAKNALDIKGYVSPIELLLQMNLLKQQHLHAWEKGLYSSLYPSIQGSPKKLANTFRIFTDWAAENKLIPFDASLRTSARDQSRELQVSVDGNPETEKLFRRYYAPAGITPRKLENLKKKLNKPPDLIVFIMKTDSAACCECGAKLSRGNMIFQDRHDILCLQCADLDHLEFLPGGNAAMSRRSKKYSPLSAIVVKFNRRSRRYERRGILVTAAAIQKAETECLSDAEQRETNRIRNALRTKQEDKKLIKDMTGIICSQFPGCPPEEAEQIAAHTAQRGSGRVGRSAAGRSLQQEAIHLAVIAYIRHNHTNYDQLLMSGIARDDARRIIAGKITEQLSLWQTPNR
jgi:hypothetical protein